MKKQVFWELPKDYRLHLDLRLAEDKSSLIWLTVLQLAAVVILFAAGRMRCSYEAAFSMEFYQIAIGMAAMAVGIVVYIVAHEWVHGIAIRFITGQAADFGIDLKKGMAYASSPAYFGKTEYIIIALAPVLFWGAVLWIMLRDVSDSWFWYLYMIQVMNVSGAAGDLYVTWLTLKAPKGTIVKDSGTSMLFYAPGTADVDDDIETTADERF